MTNFLLPKSIYQFILFLLLISTLFIGCSKSGPDQKAIVPHTEVEQDQESREMLKAAEKKVKVRRTYSRFYTNAGELDDNEYFVEEIFFDETGKQAEHNQYMAKGNIDVAWEYSYDSEFGKPVKIVCTNRFGTVRFSQESTFDDYGNIISQKQYEGKIGSDEVIEFHYEDNKLVEKVYSNPQNELVKTVYYAYKDSLVTLEVTTDAKYDTSSVRQFHYNDNNQIIEIVANSLMMPNYKTQFIYNQKGLLTDIIKPLSKIKFDYNNNGDVVKETFLGKKDNLQRINEYSYNSEGMLHEKIKIAGNLNKELNIRYEYEYYN